MALAQPQRDSIPIARNSSHFVSIHNNLVEVLTQIKAIKDLSARVLWVSCRLNRSGEKEASPVFVGWVEDNEAINIRVKRQHKFAPIEIRMTDTHKSELYEECLRKGSGVLVRRNWGQQLASPGSQEIGKKFYGETDRRSVAVQINGRSVGTLNVGFQGDPGAADNDIQSILLNWAQAPNTGLVNYIKENLEYSEFYPAKP
jgi:hypothetical protein